MYLHTKNKLSRSGLSKVRALQIHRQMLLNVLPGCTRGW